MKPCKPGNIGLTQHEQQVNEDVVNALTHRREAVRGAKLIEEARETAKSVQAPKYG